jgi:hypothetical protein
VRPSNLAARHLYKTMGFQQIAIRPDYYPAVSGREGRALPRIGPVNDERSLRELELLGVAKLYGLAPSGGSAVGSAATARVEESPAAEAPAVAGASWEALREMVAACRACGLCKQRKQAVFGVGALSGPWLFVGEGPGADEDEQGEPFVGQAGRLLDNMLAAIGCERGRDTYIANVVKCRPPGIARRARRRVRRARLSWTGRSSSSPRGSSWRSARPRSSAARDRCERGEPAQEVHRYRGIRSCAPTIRPTCCAAFPRRRKRGRTCCSRAARCASRRSDSLIIAP